MKYKIPFRRTVIDKRWGLDHKRSLRKQTAKRIYNTKIPFAPPSPQTAKRLCTPPSEWEKRPRRRGVKRRDEAGGKGETLSERSEFRFDRRSGRSEVASQTQP